jgi:hypothetical protein
MSFGTTSQTILANRVKILRGATEVTLTSDVKVRHTRTRDRLETRAGPIDTRRWRLIEIEFSAALTELLLTQIQTDSTIDGNGAMTFNNWTVTGISHSGSAGDNTSDVLSATLDDYEELAPENGTAQVRVKLVVAASAN